MGVSPHSLLPLVAFVLNVSLAALSLLRNPGSRLNRVFAYFAAGINVNVWDVQDDIQRLVRAGYAGVAVDPATLSDPAVPLADLGG